MAQGKGSFPCKKNKHKIATNYRISLLYFTIIVTIDCDSIHLWVL